MWLNVELQRTIIFVFINLWIIVSIYLSDYKTLGKVKDTHYNIPESEGMSSNVLFCPKSQTIHLTYVNTEQEMQQILTFKNLEPCIYLNFCLSIIYQNS